MLHDIHPRTKATEHDYTSAAFMLSICCMTSILEQKLQSVTAPVLPSPKKQDVSNLASRQVNSIIAPPIKAYVAQKGEAEQYE